MPGKGGGIYLFPHDKPLRREETHTDSRAGEGSYTSSSTSFLVSRALDPGLSRYYLALFH